MKNLELTSSSNCTSLELRVFSAGLARGIPEIVFAAQNNLPGLSQGATIAGTCCRQSDYLRQLCGDHHRFCGVGFCAAKAMGFNQVQPQQSTSERSWEFFCWPRESEQRRGASEKREMREGICSFVRPQPATSRVRTGLTSSKRSLVKAALEEVGKVEQRRQHTTQHKEQVLQSLAG